METVRKPVFKILYNDKNITKDVSEYLEKVSYSDNVDGESDEIELILSDESDVWKNEWYPEKGDKLQLFMGFDDALASCGEFEIDECVTKGPPDTFTIRALATWFTSAIRTKKSFAYDDQTLKEIAQKVCDRNGLKLLGDFFPLRISRSTQNRETDLAYLKRIAEPFGYMFSIRGKTMIFTSIYEIEKSKPILSIDKTDISDWEIKDKTSDVFAGANVSYHNPKSKSVIEKMTTTESIPNRDGFVGTYIRDIKEVRAKAENQLQAEQIGKAVLHRKNSMQQSGSLIMELNPLCVAGVNIDLTGFGKFSGKYHIYKSTHVDLRKSGGTTTVDIKRVGFIDKVKNKPKKK